MNMIPGNEEDIKQTSTIDISSIVNSVEEPNVSFSFHFDLEDMNEDISSDSDAELEIDVSEVDTYEPTSNCKRKREADQEVSVLNEMEEEIERQLDIKAAKTNLTAVNVKNILRHVITNEHVMAMVKRRLQNIEDDVVFEPKLTRAKAKELAMSQPNIPWPMTPGKKIQASEVQVLIQEELPEDSSDEEYNPDQESDDDRESETATCSDLDSQPSTPAAPSDSSVLLDEPLAKSVDVQYDSEGVFKIPGIPHVPTEEESIGQRTRSKLCLSETPLEQIEQAFVPPDITTDMYDWDWDTDEDWNNFLKEFAQPLTQEPTIEDDPEADPEYNILEDEESDMLDKEELRMDKAVKVTRKELNNLVAELFEFADMFSKQEQEMPKKKKCIDINNTSNENNSNNDSVVELQPKSADLESPKLMTDEQRTLLDEQLRYHVQFMAQQFVMTHMHPHLHVIAKTCKSNLQSLRHLNNGPNSAFNVVNLPEALNLISTWEAKFSDTSFRENYTNFMGEEIALGRIGLNSKLKYIQRFHPEMEKLLVQSKALMYPHLLPTMPFRSELNNYLTSQYLRSEESLIALGLEQFEPFVKSNRTRFHRKDMLQIDTAKLICQYLLPCRTPQALVKYIQKCRLGSRTNPIKSYYNTGTVVPAVHCIFLRAQTDLKAPINHPITDLPNRWQNYLKGVSDQNIPQNRKRLYEIYSERMQSPKQGFDYNAKPHLVDPKIDDNLLNPIVNMLPRMPSLNLNPENKSDEVVKVMTDIAPQIKIEITQTNLKLEEAVEWEEQTENTKVVTKSEPQVMIDNATVNTDSVTNDQNVFKTDTDTNIEKYGTSELESKTENTVVTESLSLTNSKKSESTLKDGAKLPELRKTTPRLAKIRSAQNMKLMAQFLGSKSSSSNSAGMKSRGKNDSVKDSKESSTPLKGDNEDEIAELMLASTTIKRDRANSKKARQARELENIKRLVEAQNDISQEERATKFAVSYIQKLNTVLEPNNPEIFKAVIKLFSDYSDKLEAIDSKSSENNAMVIPDEDNSAKLQLLVEDKRIREENRIAKDTLTMGLYSDICEKLKDFPDLRTDFLLFLRPHQAAMIGKSVEHTMLQRMSEFVDVAQIYFAKQPSRLSKVMQAITHLASEPYVTLEKANAVMGPLLKGHPIVMDTFLQVLPNGKPPESMFKPHMFENLTCPPGPHDKNKVYVDDAPELFENIEMPVTTTQEDPYGGDNCKCECHNMDNHSLKTRSEHCISCGTRFLNGRIYLQTSGGLRPAKITFSHNNQEERENIARVSLKTAERFIPVPPVRRRRKSTKNVAKTEIESNQKQTLTKSSPTKDSEDSDKSPPKPRRSAKSPTKSRDRKKSLKISEVEVQMKTCSLTEKKEPMSPVKTKREERAEKREAKDLAKLEQEKISARGDTQGNETLVSTDEGTSKQLIKVEDISVEAPAFESNFIKSIPLEYNSMTDSDAYETATGHDDIETNMSLDKMDVSSNSGDDAATETENFVDIRPWTRQEDAILLESVKKEYSENTFLMVSETLGSRTVQQVKERFQVLLSLLEKMV